MTRMALRFTAGRYHATPWGHHVNEGVPEWPPAPWRLLRALVAALHAAGDGLAADERASAWSAVLKLIDPPEFVLPRAGVGHTRHYMSLNQLERAKTALVIDAFVVVERDEAVIVRWPVGLTAPEQAALARLVACVNYLGRAEAWCEMELLPEAGDDHINCAPSDGSPAIETETVRVLCPAAGVAADDIERSTDEIQREGWSDAPGTRWVFYRRSADALRPKPARIVPPPPRETRPTVVELALGGTVLPRLFVAAPLAALVRSAALSHHVAQGNAAHSSNLSGKSLDGQPSKEQHRHAHFVPEARGTDDRVTHVVVWAPDGFTADELDALGAVRLLNLKNLHCPAAERTQQHEYSSDREVVKKLRDAAKARNHEILRVLISAVGTADDFRDRSPLFHRATRAWRSRTPFVLPRHIKKGRESPGEQLGRELALRGLPAPEVCVPVRGAALVPHAGDELLTRWVEFDVRRDHKRPTTPITGFRLRFAEPVAGPLLLGWGCHYGLGAFEPDDAASPA